MSLRKPTTQLGFGPGTIGTTHPGGAGYRDNDAPCCSMRLSLGGEAQMPERHARARNEVRDRPTAATHHFAARFFGPFQISRDGDPIDDAAELGRTSARTLLKWFLLNEGVRIESPQLNELLWPGRRSRSNPNRLHVTLHYLRHLLEPGLAARQPSTFIRSDGKGR